MDLTTEEKEYIIYFITKHRPNYHIAFRIVNKLKKQLTERGFNLQ